jgi:hypothetical protein
MRRWAACVLTITGLVYLLTAGCGEKAEMSELARHLPDPDAVSGVSGMGEIAEYAGETLYDFLNGGAEIYFDYGIVSIASSEYRGAADRGIEVSIYDMGSAAGAFGIYSNIRYAGADFVDVGNEGMLTMSSLDFYKGRYYCRLLTFDMTPETQAVMLELGRALAGNIAGGGSVPAIVDLLPEDGRVARSEKVFRGLIGLNNIRYISSENVLNLGPGTQGAAASYRMNGTAYAVFVIEYGSEDEAGAALESYRSHVGDEAGTTAERTGRYLAGVWDLDGRRASDVLDSVRAVLKERP